MDSKAALPTTLSPRHDSESLISIAERDEDLESELRVLFFQILLGQEHFPSNTEQSHLLVAKIAAILDEASETIRQLIIFLAPFTSQIPNDLSPFLALFVESDCLSLSEVSDSSTSRSKFTKNNSTPTAGQPAEFTSGAKTLLAQFAATLAKFETLGLVQNTEETNMRTFHPYLKNYLALHLRQNEDICSEVFKVFVGYQWTQFHDRFDGTLDVDIFKISDAIMSDDSNYLSMVAYPVLELECMETMLITPHWLIGVICGISWKTDIVLVNAEVLMPLCLAFVRKYPTFKKLQSRLKDVECKNEEMERAIQGIRSSKEPLKAAGTISIWIAHYFEYGLSSELKDALREADDLYFLMEKHLPPTDHAIVHCSFWRRLLELILSFRELANAGDLIKAENFLRTSEAEIESRQNACPTSTELAYELAHCRQMILEWVIEKDSPSTQVRDALSKYEEILDKCLAFHAASPLFGIVYVGWACLVNSSARTPRHIPAYRSGLVLALVEFWQSMGPIQPGRNRLLRTLDQSIEIGNWQSELMAYQQISRIAIKEERWIDAASTQIKIIQFSQDKGLPVEEDDQITAIMQYAMCLNELDKPAEAASLLEGGLRGTGGDAIDRQKYQTIDEPLKKLTEAARASLTTPLADEPPKPPPAFQEKTIRLLTAGMLPAITPIVLDLVLPTNGAEDTDLESEWRRTRAKKQVETTILKAFFCAIANAEDKSAPEITVDG
ncbi:MAG: hypothetical protein M1813_001362 [Trichoglossum hirsutum]|nr:MAG: hypothetical protein M1813_001362 [Trichoglossum hirsutum]